jgi:hypothetical protein
LLPHLSAPHLSRDRVNEGVHLVLAQPGDEIVVNDYARGLFSFSTFQ